MLDHDKSLYKLVDQISVEIGTVYGREACYIFDPSNLRYDEPSVIERLKQVFENIRLIDVGRVYNIRINYFDFLCCITENSNYMKGVIKLSKFGLKKGGYILQIFEGNGRRNFSAKLSIPGFKIIDTNAAMINEYYSCRVYKKL